MSTHDRAPTLQREPILGSGGAIVRARTMMNGLGAPAAKGAEAQPKGRATLFWRRPIIIHFASGAQEAHGCR